MLLHNGSTNLVKKADNPTDVTESNRAVSRRLDRPCRLVGSLKHLISSDVTLMPLRLALIVIVMFSFVERVKAQAVGDVFDQFFRYTSKEQKPFFQDAPGKA